MRALAVVTLTVALWLIWWWTTQPAQTAFGGSEWNNN